MLRWIFLVFALVFFALSLLTVFRAPSGLPWQLAVLAGEYGHLLGLAAIGVASLNWGLRGVHARIAGISLALLALSVLLYAKPLLQASRIGSTLPDTLRRQFQEVDMSRPAFSVRALFSREVDFVSVRPLLTPGDLPMDFYVPVQERATSNETTTSGPPPGIRKAPQSSAPCVIVVHGGGWDSGHRGQLARFNHWLARRGFAVAAISYRLAPEHAWPAQRDDVLAAITFIKSRSAELGIDPTRLVLLGRSAGGQIAQAVGYTANDPAIRGVIGLYSPADLIFGYAHADENDMLNSPRLMRRYLGGTPDTARANYESASAHLHVNARTPPSLLVHGENDALVWRQHSVRLDAKLAEYGVPRVFVSLPWATHAFDFNLNGPGGQLTTYAVEWFLRSVTRVDP